MAETINTFNEYVEEGTKLAEFKEIYSTFEKMGKDIKNLKGLVDSVKNLEALSSLKDKFEANVSLGDKLKEALKDMGLSDKAISLMSNITNKIDPFVMSIYGTIETFSKSILSDIVSTALSKLYIPEDVFLAAVKSMALARSDPNLRGVLRNAILRHDLVKTIEWLDNYNNTTYELNSPKSNDAVIAAQNGSFNVAVYILKQLKKSYAEIKSSALLTRMDEDRIRLTLLQYENFYNKVIKDIFVHSYDNLTVNKFQEIIKQFPTFTPSCMGTNDDTYSKRSLITNSDIDILAPLRYYRTVREYTGDGSGEMFIVPRNKNIKKLYVWLAFSTEFNDNKRLINEALHKRLKYKILSTAEKAFYEAQNTFLNSPLGGFISGAQEDYLSMIASYVNKVDKFLYDPKKQDDVTGLDTVTLPDFRPRLTTGGGTKTTLEESLPKPSSFSKSGLSYNDFEVYYVDPLFSKEKITKDAISIVEKRSLPYMMAKDVPSYSPGISQELVIRQYFIFYNNRFSGSIEEADRNEIINYIITKYLVDYYSEKGYVLETIAAMFPELNNAGLFSLFNDYYGQLLNANEDEKDTNSGLNRPLVDIAFYKEVMNPNGEMVKIEDSGVNTYNIFGEKIHTYTSTGGSVVGISIVDNDTYIMSLNPKNGNIEAYYSPDEGLTCFPMEGNANAAVIYPGVGITSIHQINFFKSIYYNDILFVAYDDKISYSSNKTDFEDLVIDFGVDNVTILGLSILPNGTLYILTTMTIYMIENFDIMNNQDFTVVRIANNDGKFTVISDVIGTIINAVSIPLNTTDDFDIDDKEIINKLILYYRTQRLIYYWYSAESPVTLDLFDNNISRLQGQLAITVDQTRRIQLQKCIERQEYFRSRFV